MRITENALTFDDVLLLPAYSNVLPRDVSLTTHLTKNIQLNAPILSAAMDTVTNARLAIALAQEGCLGIIHKNMTVEAQAEEVRRVKRFENGMVNEPLSVTPSTTLKELHAITHANNISGMPVVDDNNQLVGIITSRDTRFETDLTKPVAQAMTTKDKLVTVKEGTTRETIVELLHQHKIEKVLVVNDQFELKGMFTVRDIQTSKEKPLASKDKLGQLRVGAAVGTGAMSSDRVSALVDAGVDVIALDTAHGHSQGVLDKVKWIKKHYPDVDVIGGNIATGAAAKALADAGVDAVKVGIGPGSICTTRVVTGVGVPQITAISNVVEAIKHTDVKVIADGGIRYSGDICKAIAAGAHTVMIGSLFAGTEEAPGEVELYHGRSYKAYRGMGSLGAMSQLHGSSDRYFQSNREGVEKLVPEGIEGRVPYKGTVLAILHQMLGGLRSGMGYTGCADIDTLRTQSQMVKVSNAGIREGHVHDVSITKEAPNYQVEEV